MQMSFLQPSCDTVLCSAPLPPGLFVTAVDSHGNPISLEHKDGRVHALQFNPASADEQVCEKILRNMLQLHIRQN